MLSKEFRFTQSSLQDYVDCPRRFQLRYVQNQPWPAVEADPILEHERHLERGVRFHRLIERHQLGISPNMLEATIDDPDLMTWWHQYLRFGFLHDLPGERYPEFTLSTAVSGVRLAAAYDLLVVSPGEKIVIFDWKTYQRPPSVQTLQNRLQTRVYPFVLSKSGSDLYKDDLHPNIISMVYWVTSSVNPIVFDYSAAQMQSDELYLTRLIEQIKQQDSSESWPLTPDTARCKFCVYRSLCDRGISAGTFTEYDADESFVDMTLSLDDVEEIGF